MFRSQLALLVDRGHPLGIILFGSQARGTATADSDVDLLVIDEMPEIHHCRAIMCRQALRPRVTSVDLLVLTPQETREEYERSEPYMVDVLKEGRWVYGNSRRAGLSDLGTG